MARPKKENELTHQNIITVRLLIDEKEFLGYLQEGYDLVAVAKLMYVNVNLLLLKSELMNKENSEYNLNLPYVSRRDFLGTIEDNAGELWRQLTCEST